MPEYDIDGARRNQRGSHRETRYGLARHMTRFAGLNGLDRLILAHIDTAPGVFFEAGANDGINQSNTFALEENFGWTGVLVEPIPERFEECVRNRPKSSVHWGALTSVDDHRPTIPLTYCDLMTVAHSQEGVPAWHDDHIAAGRQWLKAEDEVRRIEAPALTISGILDKVGSPAIDFMSLDMEGYELEALRGLDLSRHAPRHIVIELRPANAELIEDALAGAYRPPVKLTDYGGHWDAIFTRKDT